MKIMVSACLMGENCKYNGGNNANEKLKAFLEGHQVILVCPEVMGGLPIPRDPAEIVDGVVRQRIGRSVDAEFREGAWKAYEIAQKEKPDLVILQSRSPSCGVKQVYDGTFSGKLISGKGVFAQMLEEMPVSVIDVEDI